MATMKIIVQGLFLLGYSGVRGSEAPAAPGHGLSRRLLEDSTPVLPTFELLEEKDWLTNGGNSVCSSPESCEGICITDAGACQEETGTVSVMLWVKVPDGSALADNRHSLFDMHFLAHVECNGWILLAHADVTQIYGHYCAYNMNPIDWNARANEWVHMALTITPSTSVFYLDGVEAARWNTYNYVGDCSGECPVVYGSSRHTKGFAGMTKELRIFKDHELSAAELRAWKDSSTLAFYNQEELTCQACELNSQGSGADLPSTGPFTLMMEVAGSAVGHAGLIGWGDSDGGDYIALRIVPGSGLTGSLHFYRGITGSAPDCTLPGRPPASCSHPAGWSAWPHRGPHSRLPTGICSPTKVSWVRPGCPTQTQKLLGSMALKGVPQEAVPTSLPST